MQPFFPTSFCKKIEISQKKPKSTRGSVVVDAVPVCESSGGVHLQAPQQPCVMQQGHHATSSPLGLQPQHSKPPS